MNNSKTKNVPIDLQLFKLRNVSDINKLYVSYVQKLGKGKRLKKTRG